MIAALALAGALSARAADDTLRFGVFQSEIRGLSEPVAARYDASGRLWVVERFAARVRAFGVDGRESASLTVAGRDLQGLALGPADEVIVADGVSDRVLVLDEHGAIARSFGRRGAGPGELRDPRGLAVRDAQLYVADSGNHRVSVFDFASGKPLVQIGRRGRGDGELLAPSDVAIDASGRVFVADLGNERVVRFGADGEFERAWGGLGPFAGLFHAPIALDLRGQRLFVADQANHRVQEFDLDGEQVHEWGIHALLPHEGGGKLHYPSAIAISADGARAAVAEGVEDRVQVFGAAPDLAPVVSSERDTAAHYGGGCAVAGQLLAVLEPSGPNVSIFDLSIGTPVEITRFGASGAQPGKLLEPTSVAFDQRGESVWIADPLAGRISLFDVSRKPGAPLRYEPFLARFVRALDVAALAESTARATWRAEPCALFVTAQNEMLVADRANARVLVLDQHGAIARQIGRHGTSHGELLLPVAVAASRDGQTIAVADARGRKIETYDHQGASLATIELDARPAGVAVRADGELWVTLEDRGLLVRIDVHGKVAQTIGARDAGSSGLGKLELARPAGLALDASGRLFAIDAGNHRFQVLGPNGEYVTMWGARLFTDAGRQTK